MAIADKITKLTAVCMACGKDAHFSQRLIDGRAAKFNDPIIMVGTEDVYQARCRDCFIIDRIQWSPAELQLS
jgi:thymidine kinase